MAEYRFREFQQDCAEQQVQLDARMLDAGQKGRSPTYHRCYEPNALLACLATGGVILRKDPTAKLADGTLELTPEMAAQAESRALVAMINTSIERLSGDEQPALPDFKMLGKDACLLAEPRFTSTLGKLATAESFDVDDYGSQIVTATDGLPLLLRKSKELKTALLLRDATVQGVLLPAGGLFCLAGSKGSSQPDNHKIEIVPVTAIEGVEFLRATGYSIEAARRSTVFREAYKHMDKTERRLFDRLETGDLMTIVTRFMARAAVHDEISAPNKA